MEESLTEQIIAERNQMVRDCLAENAPEDLEEIVEETLDDETDEASDFDEIEEEGDLPEDKMYLYDLLSLDPAFAMKLEEMSAKLPEERIVQIIANLSIRAAACVNNRNPIEGYFWAITTADLIMAICAKQEIDPIMTSEFINVEQFEYLLRQFEEVTTEDLPEKSPEA